VSDANKNFPLNYAAAGVRALRPYVPGKPLDELEREYGIRNAVKLASNENPAGPSPMVLRAVEAAAKTINRYPDGAGFKLKKSLAMHLGVEPRQLTLGNGSNDILVLLAEVFLTAATNAVFSEYAFLIYPLAVQATSAESRVVPANGVDHPQALGHDLNAMLAAIDESTRLVFIANPNNPTGTWLEPEALYAFLQKVPPTTVVVLDEAYCEYIGAQAVRKSLAWLSEFPNLVVTRTFSKIYGLAGLRVGYSVSSPAMAELLNRIRQPFNINSIALAAAEAALVDQSYIEASRKANSEGLAFLTEAVTSIAGVRVIPSQGNFVLIDLGRPALPVYEALLHAGVIVRPVGNYGLPNHLRVTAGSTVENATFLTAFSSVLDNLV
jgi:histidinol-phosphate aminotransferase